MAQRFADVALEAAAKFFPGRRHVEHEVRLRRLPLQPAVSSQRLGERCVDSGPMNPIPTAGLLQMMLHCAGRQYLLAGVYQWRGNLANGRIGAQQIDADDFERAQPAAADDEGKDGDTGTLRIAQHIK